MWGFSRRFKAVLGGSGASRSFQGPPQPPPEPRTKNAPPRTAKASNLGEAEISRGMVRLTRSPTMAEGGGSGRPMQESRGGF